MFRLMGEVYSNGLTNESPLADVAADALKVPLRSHQQAALYAMEKKERDLINGLDCSGETLFSSYGILGDSVGVGKSLMVLSHITRLSTMPPLANMTTMGANSSNNVFSIKHEPFTDLSEAGSLIIVPHTLFRQWADYIKKQTHLKHAMLDKKKALTQENFTRDIMAADVVLISNTQYREFSAWQVEQKIRWKRVFIDEADTIHLVNGYPKPETRFTWFITASWMNLIFPNETVYVQQQAMQSYVFAEDAIFPFLRSYFEETFRSNRPTI